MICNSLGSQYFSPVCSLFLPLAGKDFPMPLEWLHNIRLIPSKITSKFTFFVKKFYLKIKLIKSGNVPRLRIT